jgi:L-threonylcarbamoyladenylate synthase
MTASLTTDPALAARILARGGIVGLPTETVYGLAAHAERGDAVRRIFAIKGRPAGHPLIVHGADPGVLDRYADTVTGDVRRLGDAFWPGPLTIVVPRSARVPDEVTGGRSTVGLRVPNHRLTLRVLELLGAGVAAPSANLFGRTSPTTAEHVRDDLGEVIDLIVDGGPCSVGVESTIVDMSGTTPVILRTGGIQAEQIETVLGRAVERTAAGPARAPGMLEAHYAPAARVVVTDSDGLAAAVTAASSSSEPIVVIAPPDLEVIGAPVVLRPRGRRSEDFARDLYGLLRDADRAGAATIVVVPPAGEGIAIAVRDRLRRAAAAGAGTR